MYITRDIHPRCPTNRLGRLPSER